MGVLIAQWGSCQVFYCTYQIPVNRQMVLDFTIPSPVFFYLYIYFIILKSDCLTVDTILIVKILGMIICTLAVFTLFFIFLFYFFFFFCGEIRKPKMSAKRVTTNNKNEHIHKSSTAVFIYV